MQAYRYFGKSITTSGADEDLIDTVKTDTGLTQVVAKKVTMLSSAVFTFKMNGDSWANEVYQDSDSIYKVSLVDVAISSIVIPTSGKTVFLAIEF